MEKTAVKTNLEEGKYYSFKISGSVILPDGSECYILTDINRVKHLLYKDYYHKYNMKLNQEILCRIDKINCTGKIYIEPEHPFYKLGNSYKFKFSHYTELENSEGIMESLAVLKNGQDDDIYLAADEIEKVLKPGEVLEAIVERLKKGRVYISVGASVNDYTGLETGKKYRFTIMDQVAAAGNYTYFVIKDDNGKDFRIRKKFYDKYGMKIGDQITCELMETDHQVFLEPQHPFYEIGFNYHFKIIGETIIDEYPELKKAAFRLQNDFGKDIILKKEDVDTTSIKDDLIKCRVTHIKKSQVYITCVE